MNLCKKSFKWFDKVLRAAWEQLEYETKEERLDNESPEQQLPKHMAVGLSNRRIGVLYRPRSGGSGAWPWAQPFLSSVPPSSGAHVWRTALSTLATHGPAAPAGR